MRIVHALPCAAWLLLAAACADGGEVSGPAERRPDAPAPRAGYVRPDFVYAEGGTFKVNGATFKHVGANISELIYNTDTQVLAELDLARNSGIKQVRVFLPNDGWTTSQIISRLDWVAWRAYERGIRLTVALTHNYRQEVWGAERGSRNGAVPLHAVGDDGRTNAYASHPNGFYSSRGNMLTDAWIHWGHTAWYKPFAATVAGALRDHPGIFAWDIANEVNIEHPANVQLQIDFYRGMAAELKRMDPNHMVTTGLISTHWAWLQSDATKDAIYGDPNIDYVTVHEYDDASGSPNREDMHSEKDDMWRANTRWNKPVVIEEYGTSHFSRAEAYYQKHYLGDSRFQVDAILTWGWTAAPAGQDWGNQSTHYSPKQQGMVQPYQDLALRWAGHWNGTRVSVVSQMHGKCLDAPASANDTRLHMWDCQGTGNANQRFTRTPAGELRVHGKCVDAHASQPGDPVKVYTCHGGNNQKWDLTSTGQYLLRGTSLCMDIVGAGTANGIQLVLYGCHGGSNQRWRYQDGR